MQTWDALGVLDGVFQMDREAAWFHLSGHQGFRILGLSVTLFQGLPTSRVLCPRIFEFRRLPQHASPKPKPGNLQA